ncbi:2-octaprenyl-6-methoxyphenol hydroxylase [Nitrosomonas marina]|uniref:2-octaprenyl-6-methoxyphenol hydroxylase n=1 Tax=Nitrosomonas marina TaxID=917 RepID=A0A1I0CMG6_9PROT|nr:FAD-dependent monooxygenase [Nitrosomonas marina]SET20836.1 2-octaprenyl-6-methoxyphenol hydroxylase [Nitrosomonas marina]
MQDKHYDIVIIGGGPVGMALALALRNSNLTVLLLEARGLPEKVDDERPLALSHGSYLILRRLGVWNMLSRHTPIQTIHISNKGFFGRTVLTTEDAGVPALGYVVNYHDLYRALYEATVENEIQYQTGVAVKTFSTDRHSGHVQYEHEGVEKDLTAKLLVLADGGRLSSQIEGIAYQTEAYDQWAIVANVKAEIQQTGIAYERFTSEGPVALLPSGDDFALVWTTSPENAKVILALNEAQFLQRLYNHFGDRLGRFVATGKRSGFPLALKYAISPTTQRIALVGNAAQTLHPVAGQGFNLGLRDAYELALELIAAASENKEVGALPMLARYRDRRRADSQGGRIFTDSLIKLFSNDNMLLGHLCGMGLTLLDNCPPMKRFVSRRMIFGSRG